MNKYLIILGIVVVAGVAFVATRPTENERPCQQRPACLDAQPRCLLPEPAEGWCSSSPTPQPTKGAGSCYVGGCSSQLCTDQPDAVSTCEYRAEYACYRNAQCERQANGSCGWTPTSQLTSCLANPN